MRVVRRRRRCGRNRGERSPGILSSHLHADGNYRNMLSVPGSVRGGKVEGRPFLQMAGNAVFKFAVRVLDEPS